MFCRYGWTVFLPFFPEACPPEKKGWFDIVILWDWTVYRVIVTGKMRNNNPIDIGRYPSEVSFIQSLKRGDPGAFTCVYLSMHSILSDYACRIVRSKDEVEDIIATVFLKLYAHGRKDLHSLNHLKRWLFIVVRNDSINLLRHKRQEQAAKREIAYVFPSSDELPVGADYQMLERQARMEVENLPKQAKLVARLYFFDSKETKEISGMLNLNSQTVLNHKAKALKALRKRITRVEA